MDAVADRRAPAGRSRRLTSGVATSLLSRGASMAVPVILIPLTYRYFGPTQYAAWATIVATTSMFLWADLGLGNGLLTKVTPLLAAGDFARARELVSTAYVVLGIFALVMVGLLVGSVAVVPWATLLGLGQAEHVSEIVVILLGLMLLNVPLSLVQRIQYAAGEVSISNLVQLCGPVIALAGASVGVALEAPVMSIILVIAVAPLVANVVATAQFFARWSALRPRRRCVQKSAAASLLALGAGFLFVQVVSSIAMNTDNPVAAHVAGAPGMADFAVTSRVFLLLGGLVTVMFLPLWPANADALARGDVEWVRMATRRMCVLGSTFVLCAGLSLVLVGEPVLGRLLGDGFDPDVIAMGGFTAYWFVVALASPWFMVQNAVGSLAPQMMAWPVFLVVSVALKYGVGGAAGTSLIPAMGAVAYAVVLMPAAFIGYRRCLESSVTVGRHE